MHGDPAGLPDEDRCRTGRSTTAKDPSLDGRAA